MHNTSVTYFHITRVIYDRLSMSGVVTLHINSKPISVSFHMGDIECGNETQTPVTKIDGKNKCIHLFLLFKWFLYLILVTKIYIFQYLDIFRIKSSSSKFDFRINLTQRQQSLSTNKFELFTLLQVMCVPLQAKCNLEVTQEIETKLSTDKIK